MLTAIRNLLTGVPAEPTSFAGREGARLQYLGAQLKKATPGSAETIQRLIDGYKVFAKSSSAPDQAYYAFRDLYFDSRASSNKLINDHVSGIFPADPMADAPSLLGSAAGPEVARIVDQIRANGYYRFPKLLPSNLVRDIKARLDAEAADGASGTIANDGLARTTFAEELLLRVPGVAALAADPLLRQIAAQYLNTSPVMGFVTSWISRAHGNDRETMSKAAQMFHVDMSNPNFLKAFVYLDEVTDENGPHCLVPGSHRHRDAALWRDGRVDDQEMARYYPEQDWAVLKGEPGSMFIVDTSAFHKGCAVLSGERHILQFYYVDTLFGEAVPPTEGAKSFDLKGFGDVPARFLSRLAPAGI